MRRVTFSFLTLFVVGYLIAGTAAAQSGGAHFQKSSVKASISNGGDLTVSWVEAGLGNGNVDYTLTADVTADYYCTSKSGGTPNAANKFTSSGSPEANGSFESKNGKVSGRLTLSVPAAPSSEPPTCGRGQTLALQQVTWSNVLLTDVTNVVSYMFPGTFGRTFYAID